MFHFVHIFHCQQFSSECLVHRCQLFHTLMVAYQIPADAMQAMKIFALVKLIKFKFFILLAPLQQRMEK